MLAHSYNTWGPQFEFEGRPTRRAPTKPLGAPARSMWPRKSRSPSGRQCAQRSAGTQFERQSVFTAVDLVAEKDVLVFYGRDHQRRSAEKRRRPTVGSAAGAQAPPRRERCAIQLERQLKAGNGEVVRVTSTTRSYVFRRFTRAWPSTGSTSRAPRRRKDSNALPRPDSSTPCRSTTSQTGVRNQEEAPVLTAKLKDAGVTTVLLYAPYTMDRRKVFKAATNLDYFP